MKHSVKLMILTVVLALAAGNMFATTISTVNTNNVFTTVVGKCQWVTPLVLAFPNYDPFVVGPTTQSAAVAFQCVKKTNATDSYKIWFSKTSGNMVNGVDTLAYTLTDTSNNPLPTTAATSTAVAGTPGIGAAAGYSFTVNGSIAGQQDVPVGLYQDTVVANVEY
jgi:spore coat protein U-like protein